MSSEWPIKALSEIAEILTGFPFKGSEYLPPKQGVRVVRGDNVTEQVVRWGEKEKCWGQVTPSLTPYLLQTGDIVIGMDGSKVGKNFAAILPEDDGALLAQRVARVRAREGVSQSFLRYLICNGAFTEYVKAVHTGTSIPHISKGQIEVFKVCVPPLQEQFSIAEVLSSLDDRITLLRETNATLEAIAQALFKSWFVDFDPVRAKMEGRSPEGMDEVTAALFPDSFEESELGLMPSGWKVARLDSFIELVYGKALKAENRTAGLIPVYGSGGITGWHDQALVEQASIIVGRKGTVGSIFWESRPFFPIDTVFYVKSQKPLTYCYLLLKTLRLDSMNTDAAVPGLNRENVYRLLVIEPPENVLAAFDSVTSVLRQSMDENEAQAQTLATVRDTLLPRLISGRLGLSVC